MTVSASLSFLALCLLGADILAASFANNTFFRLLKESLLIGGWVAMWRPMQIFLYEWWPIVRRGRIYRNLGRANVRVVTPPAAQGRVMRPAGAQLLAK